MGQVIEEWAYENFWKTASKKFEETWSILEYLDLNIPLRSYFLSQFMKSRVPLTPETLW